MFCKWYYVLTKFNNLTVKRPKFSRISRHSILDEPTSQIHHANDDQLKSITQDCMNIDDRILAIELQIEETIAAGQDTDPLNK